MSDSLPKRMREAANGVVQEVYDRDGGDQMYWMNVMCKLLDTASNWEAEDIAAAEKETLVEELAQDVVVGFGMGWSWDVLGEKDKWLRMTRKLIAAGWTKQVQS